MAEDLQIYSIYERVSYLKDIITPEIDRIRRGGNPKTFDETYEKIFGRDPLEFPHDDTDGEICELIESIEISADQISPNKAKYLSELADVVYYAVCLENDELLDEVFFVANHLGVENYQAVQLAIMKYGKRSIGAGSKDIDGENDIINTYANAQQIHTKEDGFDKALQSIGTIISHQESYRPAQE